MESLNEVTCTDVHGMLITYTLTVQWYLHNLLLRDDGCLFHVDFGYNLGRDPKSIPPHVKLHKEMREAMGGAERSLDMHFNYRWIATQHDLVHGISSVNIRRTREAKTRKRLRMLTNQSMRLMITNNSRKEGRCGYGFRRSFRITNYCRMSIVAKVKEKRAEVKAHLEAIEEDLAKRYCEMKTSKLQRLNKSDATKTEDATRKVYGSVTPPKPDSSDKEQGGKLGPASLQKDGRSLNSSRSSGGGKSVPDASEKKWDGSQKTNDIQLLSYSKWEKGGLDGEDVQITMTSETKVSQIISTSKNN
ncbi:phosphatidylinositol 3-kinase, root isoform [Tanacetum coccineum]